MNSSANHLEYEKALRLGQKEKKALADAGRDPYPAVLDEVLPDLSVHAIRELGIIDIPADRGGRPRQCLLRRFLPAA